MSHGSLMEFVIVGVMVVYEFYRFLIAALKVMLAGIKGESLNKVRLVSLKEGFVLIIVCDSDWGVTLAALTI